MTRRAVNATDRPDRAAPRARRTARGPTLPPERAGMGAVRPVGGRRRPRRSGHRRSCRRRASGRRARDVHVERGRSRCHRLVAQRRHLPRRQEHRELGTPDGGDLARRRRPAARRLGRARPPVRLRRRTLAGHRQPLHERPRRRGGRGRRNRHGRRRRRWRRRRAGNGRWWWRRCRDGWRRRRGRAGARSGRDAALQRLDPPAARRLRDGSGVRHERATGHGRRGHAVRPQHLQPSPGGERRRQPVPDVSRHVALSRLRAPLPGARPRARHPPRRRTAVASR